MMSKSESGAQLLARLGARQSLDELESNLFNIPLSNKVIQFCGVEGTGKSELLLHLLAKCILPSKWNTFEMGGLGVRVVFIDCDHKFSILRLALVLEKRIIKAMANKRESTKHGESVKRWELDKPGEDKPDKCVTPDEPMKCGESSHDDSNCVSNEDVEAFIKDCLRNLYLVHCSSSQQLLCTLHSLENVFSTEPEISCFMIDSISSFYWPDRCNAGDSTLGQEKVMNLLVKSLEKIVRGYKLVLFVTKAEIFKSRSRDLERGDKSELKEESLVTGYSEYLGKSWGNFVDHSYLLTKNIVGDKVTFSVVQKSWKSPKPFIISEFGIEF